jgi:hypothetical protein
MFANNIKYCKKEKLDEYCCLLFSSRYKSMSELEKYKQAASQIIKTLEGALRNIRDLHSGLNRESYNGSGYERCFLLTPREVSLLLNKDEKEIELTFNHVGFKKQYLEGKPHYNLSDVLGFIANIVDHSFGMPTLKRGTE